MFLRTTPRYSSKALNSNGFPRMDAASSEATHYQYSTARIFELITPGHGRAGATRLGRLAGLAVAKYLRRASSNFSSQISGQLFGGRVVLRRPASCTKKALPDWGQRRSTSTKSCHFRNWFRSHPRPPVIVYATLLAGAMCS